MRVGISLPNLGPSAQPDAVVRGAHEAERLGYDTLWTADRLLYPVHPRDRYPATPDGSLPEYYKTVLDPLESLAFRRRAHADDRPRHEHHRHPLLQPGRVLAPAHHDRRALCGTPAGRLRHGLVEGRVRAVGAPAKGRAARANEFLEVLDRVWTTNPVEYAGEFFRVPPSFIGPKPVQKPRPRSSSPPTRRRARTVARYADGWQPNGAILLADLPRMLGELRSMIQAGGRDPSRLLLNVVATVALTPQPISGKRMFFTGSIEQVREDVLRARELGTTELILELDLVAAHRGSPADDGALPGAWSSERRAAARRQGRARQGASGGIGRAIALRSRATEWRSRCTTRRAPLPRRAVVGEVERAGGLAAAVRARRRPPGARRCAGCSTRSRRGSAGSTWSSTTPAFSCSARSPR